MKTGAIEKRGACKSLEEPRPRIAILALTF
jgi:hypothetical protein